MKEFHINAESLKIENIDGVSGSLTILPPPNGSHVNFQTPKSGGIMPLSATVNGGPKVFADQDGNLPLIVSGGGSGGVVRTVYYVSSVGNNSNNGLSPATAWQTVAKVNATALVPGDTVLFEGNHHFTGPLTLTASHNGAEGNYVTIGSYGMGKATIIGNATHGIQLLNAKHIIVRDLIVKGTGQTDMNVHGVHLQSNGATIDDVYVYNVEVYRFVGWGIMVEAVSTTDAYHNVLIEYCIAHDNDWGGICFWGAWDAVFGGYVRTGTNNTIRRCKAFNNAGIIAFTTNWSGTGIVMSGVNGGLIEFCEAYGNGYNNNCAGGCEPIGIWVFGCIGVTIQYCESYDHVRGISVSYGGGGFDIDGGSENCIIQFCYSHGNSGAGYLMYEWGDANGMRNNTIRYNISHNDGRGSYGAISIGALIPSIDGTFIHNNLVYVNDANKDQVPPAWLSPAPTAFQFATETNWINLHVFNNIFIVDGAGINMMYVYQAGTVKGTWASNIYYALNGANLNYSAGGTTNNPMLRNIPKTPERAGVFAHGDMFGALEAYKIQLMLSPARNVGTTVGAAPLPPTDFWGTKIPQGVVNIGPCETI